MDPTPETPDADHRATAPTAGSHATASHAAAGTRPGGNPNADDATESGHESSVEVAIVGSGAAGLSAALVLARARRSVVVIDTAEPRNRVAAHMHGYLSRDGAEPGELLKLGREEVLGYGASIVVDRVDRISGVTDAFELRLASGALVHAGSVIVTTGLTDTMPDIDGLDELWGTLVHHCPYCHGWECRGLDIAVIGTTGHTPMFTAILSQWSDRITLYSSEVTDRETTDALAELGVTTAVGRAVAVRAAGADSPVGTPPGEREGAAAGALITLDDGSSRPHDAVFVTTTPSPNDELLRGLGCEFGDDGLVALDRHGQTSIHGVYAAGNVSDPGALVIQAAAQGSTAGVSLNSRLIVKRFGALGGL